MNCWKKKDSQTSVDPDKPFWRNMVCVMMLTSSVGCVHLSLAIAALC